MAGKNSDCSANALSPLSEADDIELTIVPHIAFKRRDGEEGVEDETLEAQMRRWGGIEKILTTKGGLSDEEALRAVCSPHSECKEKAALWLRREHEKLRSAEQARTGAPVRLGGCMSRLEIADIAMTMLEPCESAPGDHLLSLLLELLDVDRHRVALASKQPPEFDVAAQIEGQLRAKGRSISSRKLAQAVEVNHVTITRWRNDAKYQEMVEHWAESPEERRRRIAAARNRPK